MTKDNECSQVELINVTRIERRYRSIFKISDRTLLIIPLTSDTPKTKFEYFVNEQKGLGQSFTLMRAFQK